MSGIQVNFFAVCVLYAWVPIIFGLFAVMSPRRAVIAAFVIGYLFLPNAQFSLHTLPDISKVSLTALGVVLASLVFDSSRLFSVRPRLIDLVWLVLCLSPIMSSLNNDLGIMDGLSASLNLLFRWGLAYWIGRAYFTDWEAVRELSMGVVLGALAYVPFCWWEIRMSPQLHGWIYGYTFNSFREDSYLFGLRLYGFRPNVFLADGLTVTMFMGVATLLAFWAWMCGSPKKLLRVPMGMIFGILLFTTFFSKAMGGIVLMCCGMAALTMTRKFPRTKYLVLVLMLVAPLYIIIRSSGESSGEALVRATEYVSHTRAQSLDFRLKNEDMLVVKALQRPWFGWAGWSRSHVYDLITNKDLTIEDGLWIITLGDAGIIGLGAFTLLVLGSAFMLWLRIPTKFWSDPACSGAVALAVVITLYMIDSLFNATFNQIASLAIGAVASIAASARTAFAPAPRRGFPVIPKVWPSPVKDIPYVYSAHRS